MTILRRALVVILLTSCQANGQAPQGPTTSAAALPANAVVDFTLPAPGTDPAARRMIWSTAYIAYLADPSSDPASVPLLDRRDKPVGPRLTHADWCHAAMEGTVSIRVPAGGFRTFNFDGRGARVVTDCRDIFPRIEANILDGTNRAAWRAAPPDAPFGLGVAPFRLVPFRSVAVDPNVFPFATILFIP